MKKVTLNNSYPILEFLGGPEISTIPEVSLKMNGLKDNASRHNSKKQGDAGDDNFKQTYYYSEETCN